jgi:hypothetical protein
MGPVLKQHRRGASLQFFVAGKINLVEVLEKTSGNQTQAAGLLRIT